MQIKSITALNSYFKTYQASQFDKSVACTNPQNQWQGLTSEQSLSFRGRPFYENEDLPPDILAIIKQHRPLSREDELKWFKIFNSGSSKESDEAKQILMKHNLGLVASNAKQIKNTKNSFLDKFQDGQIGLNTAIERFESHRGTRFSTYAVPWIRESIYRALYADDIIRTPKDIATQTPHVNSIISDYLNKHGILPNEETIEQELLKINKSPQRGQHAKVVSVNSTNEDGDEVVTPFFEENIGEKIFDTGERNKIYNLLGLMPERRRVILMLRMGLEEKSWTFDRIANLYGITKAAVQTQEKKAIRDFKELLNLDEDASLEELKTALNERPPLSRQAILVLLANLIEHNLVGRDREIMLHKHGFKDKIYDLQELAKKIGNTSHTLGWRHRDLIERLTEPVQVFCEKLGTSAKIPAQLTNILEEMYDLRTLLRRIKGKPDEEEIKKKILNVINKNLTGDDRKVLTYVYFTYPDRWDSLESVGKKFDTHKKRAGIMEQEARKKLLPHLKKLYIETKDDSFKTLSLSSVEIILNKMYKEPELFRPLFGEMNNVVKTKLSEKEQEVLKYRYGFNPQNKIYEQEDIAKKLGTRAEVVREIEAVISKKLAYPLINLHNKLYPDAKLPLPECSSEMVVSHKEEELQIISNWVKKILAPLSKKERDVIEARFGINNEENVYTYEKVKKELNYSSWIICINAKDALARIAEPLRDLHKTVDGNILIPSNILKLFESYYELPQFLETADKTPFAAEIRAKIKEIIEKTFSNDKEKRNVLLYRYGFKGEPVKQVVLAKKLKMPYHIVVLRDIQARKDIKEQLKNLYFSLPSDFFHPEKPAYSWANIPDEYKWIEDGLKSKVFSKLTKEELSILRLQYGFTEDEQPHNRYEIAKMLELPKSKVERRHDRALHNIFHSLIKFHNTIPPETPLPRPLERLFDEIYFVRTFMEETGKTPQADAIKKELLKKSEEILSPNELQVIKLHYGLDCNPLKMQDIPKIIHKSRKNVVYTHMSATEKLAPHMKDIYNACFPAEI